MVHDDGKGDRFDGALPHVLQIAKAHVRFVQVVGQQIDGGAGEAILDRSLGQTQCLAVHEAGQGYAQLARRFEDVQHRRMESTDHDHHAGHNAAGIPIGFRAANGHFAVGLREIGHETAHAYRLDGTAASGMDGRGYRSTISENDKRKR